MGTSREFMGKQQRVRGNSAASGRRFARTVYPAPARWANFCRAPTKESGRTNRAYGAWRSAARGHVEERAGESARKEGRCAPTVYPALTRWANFCRAYGAWTGARDESTASHPSEVEGWGGRKFKGPRRKGTRRGRMLWAF